MPVNFAICPKCQYTRRPEDEAPPEVCPACGLVFWKWTQHQQAATGPEGDEQPKIVFYRDGEDESLPLWPMLWRDYIARCPATEPLAWTGRLILFAVLLVWGGWFILLGPGAIMEIGESFLHRVDLVFHEAGHVVFMPFGDFMHILGGSLGQVLMPAVILAAFLFYNRDPFGASVGLWWLGQSLMDVSIYIADARALALPLLGGGTGEDNPDRHDWNNLLSRLGWLDHDHAIAGFTYMAGRIAMLAALFWAGSVLLRQWRRRGG